MKKLFSLLLALMLLFSLCGAVVYAEDGTDDAAPAVEGTEPPEEALPPDLTGGVVTRFTHERVFAGLKLQSYEKGKLEDLEFLIATITKALDCTVLLPDASEVSALCTAVWNTEELTLDVAGVYEVTATLSPPDGCDFADGVRRKIVIPVQIVDPDGVPVLITEIDAWIANRIAIAVPVGDPIDSVVNHVDLEGLRIKGKAENGGAHNSTVEWNFSTVDMDTPGVYRVTGTLVPPPGLEFAPELTLPEPVFTVSVQTLGSPDINCYSRGRNALLFPWVMTGEQTEQLDQFEVWMAVDGVWSRPESGYSVFLDHLEILLTNISTEHTYGLQVDYPGGQTDILTFTYDGTVLDSDYSEGDRDGDDGTGITPPGVGQPPPGVGNNGSGGSGGGDHNSGGSGGGGNTLPPPTPTPEPTPDPEPTPPSKPNPAPTPNPTPDPTPELTPTPNPTPTPAPTPESTPQPAPPAANENHTGSSAPASSGKPQPPAIEVLAPAPSQPEKPAFSEESNATSTTLSGARLRLMLAEEAGATFSKQGINVTLSAEAVTALGISDEDVVTVQILRESDRVFSFGVAVNEESVTALMGTSVSLPYTASSDKPVLSLQNDKAETAATGSYAPQSGLATFVVDAPGKYTILDEAIPAGAAPETIETTTPKAVPILPICIATVALLLLGGGVFFLRRRWRK